MKLLEEDSVFTFRGLGRGRYVVDGFMDRDGDGRPGPGAASPFLPAEPLVHLPDTVAVRPRWEAELSRPLDVAPVRIERISDLVNENRLSEPSGSGETDE